MNERERLLAVLGGEKPDLTPWYGDLSYWYHGQIEKGTLDKRYEGAEGYLRMHQDAGAGIYLYAPDVYKIEYQDGIRYSEVTEGDWKVFQYHTRMGTLTARQKYLKEACTFAYTEHFIKDIEDLRIMDYIFRNTKYLPDYKAFCETDRLWGPYGLPAVLTTIPAAPIQKLLARLAGVETAINMMVDHQEEFDEIMEGIKQSEDEVFEIICNSPGQLVEFPENLSSEITGKMLFHKYSRDYYKKRIQQLHDAGKYTALHIDGTLKGLLPELKSTGLDAAEAVTPAPAGDVEIEDLRELAGDDMIIWGGLPGALFSPLYSDSYFEDFVKRVLDAFPAGSRFVLGVADQVPPDGEFSRICRVREILESRG
ncbi:MAG TPA: hypothetical protein GX017_00580 [Clostridiales bacterium]|nr:hypothetical protein [Clostridiales bacterium]